MTFKPLLAACAAGTAWTLAAATVEVGETDFPTYPFSDPDPVPATDKPRYPYFFFDGSTATAVTQRWRTVTLESDRLRVTAMPDVGGKVWGAVDKKTGREFIYHNHAVKFRNISMRGPWCSGGIEFNFGIVGHAPSTATPVDWTVRTNADRSVSYFAGNTEYVNGTTWQVEVLLRDGEDFFTTRTTWFNGANLEGPYYQWMTAACSARGGAEFHYPGTHQIGHAGDPHPWPVDEEGHAMDTYAGNDFGSHKSLHVVNGDARLFAIWWPEWNFGSYHWNAAGEKYGRKLWLWSHARDGAIWEDLLTDSDGQYAELQSGRLFQQPEGKADLTPFPNATFMPGATDCFEERWGAIRDEAALRKMLAGTNLVTRPLAMPANFNWSSAYGHWLRGVRHLAARQDAKGEAELKAALAVEPVYPPAFDALATLACRRARWREARDWAERALAVDAYDAAANYADGLASFWLGDYARAEERLGLAAYRPDYRSAACATMAKCAFRLGDARGALERAVRSWQANSHNPEAFFLRVAAHRKLNEPDRALKLSDMALRLFPLDHALRHERHLLGAISESDFLALVRGEFPDETILGLADRYDEIGFTEEARRLWTSIADRSMLARVLLAKSFDDPAQLAEAAKLPLPELPPHRALDAKAVAWAARRSNDWRWRYLCAVWYASIGREDDARALLDCVQDASDPVFYLFRARFKKGAERFRDLCQARKKGDSWRVGRDLMAHFAEQKDWLSALAFGADYLKRNPGNDSLEILYAQALVKSGRAADCVKFLERITVLPSEHGCDAHASWAEAWRALGDEAKANTYPENLGKGAPRAAG
ncbi:MAG: DUF5107 domain-containing protein, partial [Kiritimatiellae bacterium]|nr:DUF5107 domain-containing protein [Kiritimatiellia bacterium]